MNPAEPLELGAYLAEPHLAGHAGRRGVACRRGRPRSACSREAALLGVDLLSGEEPKP